MGEPLQAKLRMICPDECPALRIDLNKASKFILTLPALGRSI